MTEDQFWKVWDLVGRWERRCRTFIRGFNGPIEGWVDHITVGDSLFVQIVPYYLSPDENLFVPVEDSGAFQNCIPVRREHFEPRGFLARLASMKTPRDDFATGGLGNYSDVQWWLGRMYEAGWGLPQNYVVAHMWFTLPATYGYFKAANERDKVA
jgi:hypothetical protein